MGAPYFAGRYNIGYWAWELPDFPAEWRSSFAYLDEIWVPSRFVLEAVAGQTRIPVVRVPHSIDLQGACSAELNPAARPPRSRFRFVFLFDFMSYWQRKNPFGLIEAFRRAFGRDDAAELLIKATHAAFAPAAFSALQQAARGARIRVMDGVWSRGATLRLLHGCDAFVSLHRSEGFGLCLAEAMALGKPVIATGFSGNRDFMSADNSLLVRHRLVDLKEDYGPYQRGSRWAEPDVAHAAELMRWVVEHPTEAAALGERAARSIEETLHPSVIGARILRRLHAIAGAIVASDRGS
jgi:glycosyltransferase involved in cell wall biosynthesis